MPFKVYDFMEVAGGKFPDGNIDQLIIFNYLDVPKYIS